MRKGLLVVGLGLIASLLTPTGAQAQRRDDWYRDVRPYLGRRGEEGARRARLWEEFVRLRSDVRTADRRGDITPRQADNFIDRLDRVGKFLRDDRNLSSSEFNRRRDDLNDVAHDLDRATRNRYSRRGGRSDSRYDQYDRRDDRYDRRDDRYDRRDDRYRR